MNTVKRNSKGNPRNPKMKVYLTNKIFSNLYKLYLVLVNIIIIIIIMTIIIMIILIILIISNNME